MDISNDEKEELRAIGGKLGFLIKHSSMPEEVKKELFQLIPHMEVEQIERLLSVLEAKFLDEQTRSIDDEYRQKTDKVYKDYILKQKEFDEKFLNQVNKIVNS